MVPLSLSFVSSHVYRKCAQSSRSPSFIHLSCFCQPTFFIKDPLPSNSKSMRATLIGLSSLLIITLAVTDDGHLDKPPLADNLDYLQKGLLESLHPKNSSYTKWSPHWIPADCKSLTEDNNMSAIDVEAFSVRYPDVSTRICILWEQTN